MRNFRYFSLIAVLFSSLAFACNDDNVKPLKGGGDEEDDDPIIIPPPPPSGGNAVPIDSIN